MNTLPAPIDGDFDIPMPDDSTEVSESNAAASSAMDDAWARYTASGQRERDEIHRAHLQELNAGLHNLHEPFEGLVR